MAGKDQFNWRLLLCAAFSSVVVMLLSFVYSRDPVLDYMFLIAPIACLAFLVMLAVAIVKRTRKSLSVLVMVLAFFFTSGAMLKTQDIVRPSLRWLLWSKRLKAEVLAQPTPTNEDLKHIEWDGWGGAPVGDWTAYVVYDPTDSLSGVAKDGQRGLYKKVKGIPCEVDSVRRLENQWYSVMLGVNEWWDRCG